MLEASQFLASVASTEAATRPPFNYMSLAKVKSSTQSVNAAIASSNRHQSALPAWLSSCGRRAARICSPHLANGGRKLPLVVASSSDSGRGISCSRTTLGLKRFLPKASGNGSEFHFVRRCVCPDCSTSTIGFIGPIMIWLNLQKQHNSGATRGLDHLGPSHEQVVAATAAAVVVVGQQWIWNFINRGACWILQMPLDGPTVRIRDSRLNSRAATGQSHRKQNTHLYGPTNEPPKQLSQKSASRRNRRLGGLIMGRQIFASLGISYCRQRSQLLATGPAHCSPAAREIDFGGGSGKCPQSEESLCLDLWTLTAIRADEDRDEDCCQANGADEVECRIEMKIMKKLLKLMQIEMYKPHVKIKPPRELSLINSLNHNHQLEPPLAHKSVQPPKPNQKKKKKYQSPNQTPDDRKCHSKLVDTEKFPTQSESDQLLVDSGSDNSKNTSNNGSKTTKQLGWQSALKPKASTKLVQSCRAPSWSLANLRQRQYLLKSLASAMLIWLLLAQTTFNRPTSSGSHRRSLVGYHLLFLQPISCSSLAAPDLKLPAAAANIYIQQQPQTGAKRLQLSEKPEDKLNDEATGRTRTAREANAARIRRSIKNEHDNKNVTKFSSNSEDDAIATSNKLQRENLSYEDQQEAAYLTENRTKIVATNLPNVSFDGPRTTDTATQGSNWTLATSGSERTTKLSSATYRWPFVGLVSFIFVGATGNILVCAAVWRERRLQTATNYFLLSLAVADLLVCTLVMPFGIIYEFYGRWPFDWRICNLWVTWDVLTCSSSILHMCFISVGRYLGIRNPLHARQTNLFVSRRAVLWRIALAWISAALIASPLTMMSLYDHRNIVPSETECAISNRYFLIFAKRISSVCERENRSAAAMRRAGSMSAFFIPMFVMVWSYVMTVRLLSRRAKFVRNSSQLLLTNSANHHGASQSLPLEPSNDEANGSSSRRRQQQQLEAGKLARRSSLNSVHRPSSPQINLASSSACWSVQQQHRIRNRKRKRSGSTSKQNGRGGPPAGARNIGPAARLAAGDRTVGRIAQAWRLLRLASGGSRGRRWQSQRRRASRAADEPRGLGLGSGVELGPKTNSDGGSGLDADASKPSPGSWLGQGIAGTKTTTAAAAANRHNITTKADLFAMDDDCRAIIGPNRFDAELAKSPIVGHGRRSDGLLARTPEPGKVGDSSARLGHNQLLVQNQQQRPTTTPTGGDNLDNWSQLETPDVAPGGQILSATRFIDDDDSYLGGLSYLRSELPTRTLTTIAQPPASSQRKWPEIGCQSNSSSVRIDLEPAKVESGNCAPTSAHGIETVAAHGQLACSRHRRRRRRCCCCPSADCRQPPEVASCNLLAGEQSNTISTNWPLSQCSNSSLATSCSKLNREEKVENFCQPASETSSTFKSLQGQHQPTKSNQLICPNAEHEIRRICSKEEHDLGRSTDSVPSNGNAHCRRPKSTDTSAACDADSSEQDPDGKGSKGHHHHRHGHHHHHRHHRKHKHHRQHGQHHCKRHRRRGGRPSDQEPSKLDPGQATRVSPAGQAAGQNQLRLLASDERGSGQSEADGCPKSDGLSESAPAISRNRGRSETFGSSIMVAAIAALPSVLGSARADPSRRRSTLADCGARVKGSLTSGSTSAGSNSLQQQAPGSGQSGQDGHSSSINNSNNSATSEPQMIRYLGSSMQVRSEQKATKVLGVVFFTFVICWSPFFVINFTQAFVDRHELAKWISNEMMTTFLWLGYISSTINPVIYTVFNRNFRNAFRQILLCQPPSNHFGSLHQSRASELNRTFRVSQMNRNQPQLPNGPPFGVTMGQQYRSKRTLASHKTRPDEIHRKGSQTAAGANSLQGGGCPNGLPANRATTRTPGLKLDRTSRQVHQSRDDIESCRNELQVNQALLDETIPEEFVSSGGHSTGSPVIEMNNQRARDVANWASVTPATATSGTNHMAWALKSALKSSSDLITSLSGNRQTGHQQQSARNDSKARMKLTFKD